MYKFISAIAKIVYAILTFACIVLAFGFALALFGANIEAGFAEFIFKWSVAFMGPFEDLIEPTELGGNSTVYWSVLFAIAAYLVLMWLVSLIDGWARTRRYLAEKPVQTAVAEAAAAGAPVASAAASAVVASVDTVAPADASEQAVEPETAQAAPVAEEPAERPVLTAEPPVEQPAPDATPEADEGVTPMAAPESVAAPAPTDEESPEQPA